MTHMNATQLKGLIEQYGRLGAPAPASAKGKKKPSLEELNQSRRTHESQQAIIDAEIDRLYGVVDNTYPKEMFERFCEVSQKVAEQAQGMLVEAIAGGADGPGVKTTAILFCKYNASVNEMVAFAKERAAKESYSFASIASLVGIGGLALSSYLWGRGKKPA